MTQKLRIGFILKGETLPAWYAHTIRAVADEGHELYFLKTNTAKVSRSLPFLYRQFLNFEKHWFRQDYNAFQSIPLSEVAASSQIIEMPTARTLQFAFSSVEKLRELHLDLLYTIDFSASENENISDIAKYGLWYSQLGHGAYRNNQLPGFWEVMDNWPVTGSYLVMRQGGQDYILYEGTTTSVPFSVKNNLNALAWKTSSYLLHRLRSLTSLNGDFLSHFNKIDFEKSKNRVPVNFEMIFLFIRNIIRYLVYKVKSKLREKKFTLLYSLSNFDFETFHNLKFSAVALPPDVFFADPFVVTRNGTSYVFFEEYVYSKNRAHISVIEIDNRQKISLPKPVLEKPYHLSYPFVFEVNGEYYMVPETSENKTVELYRSANFPLRWEFVMNLFEGQGLVDSTLIYRDGIWWLFANSSNHPSVSTNDQLFLYYSDNLFSSAWIAHPKNPIVTHAENCRPAGRIFEKDGKLYRPAQNNASQQYGFSVQINEIQTLSTQDYSEKKIFSVNPDSLGLKAVHNIDFSSQLVVVDGILK